MPIIRSNINVISQSRVVRLLIFFAFLCLTTATTAQTKEQRVKTVLIEKLASYIEWSPEARMADTTMPFTIAFLGEDDMLEAMQKILQTKRINNKRVVVKRIKKITELNQVNILYIADIEDYTLAEILAATRSLPILTITEINNYALQGVHIEFYRTARNTISFKINDKSLQKSKLKMNFMVLELGVVVDH